MEGVCYNKGMNYIFNQIKLQQVLSDFYSSTGIAITLYDASEQIIATSPVYTEFCSLIRTKRRCVECCEHSDRTHMKEVSESRKLIRYTCHAGLMETIMPIVYESIVIAYLQIGQLRDEAGLYSSPERLKKLAAQYGFDTEELLRLYDALPVLSETKLQAVYNIMEILVKSFWNDGLIDYKRSMQSVKLERYISEHLTEKLRIDELCREFFLSKNALYQLFREEFHTTVNGFILQKRLHLAKQYL